MASIFLSYRRSDSAGWAGRLSDSFRRLLPSASLFMDIETIPIGVPFEEFIGDAVERCDLLIALIGPQWLDARDETGQRRLNSSEDYMHIEIEAALKRNIRVVPVLVGGARMPSAEELPESLRPLIKRQNFELPDRGWEEACQRLAHAIEDALPGAGGPVPVKPQPHLPWKTLTVAGVGVAILIAAVLFLKPWANGPRVGTEAGGTPAAAEPSPAVATPVTPPPLAPTPIPTPTPTPTPTLLTLGLEGVWIPEGDAAGELPRFVIERLAGNRLSLTGVLGDGRRELLITASVSDDVVRFEVPAAGPSFSIVARAKPSPTRAWDVDFSTGNSDCPTARGTAEASLDLRAWQVNLSCPGARPEAVEFTATLTSDGSRAILTAKEPGAPGPDTFTLRRER